MSDSRNKSEIINPVEHYLLQQIQESGSAVRATWEVINNIVKHFFIVNAILIGFAGVVWTEYGKEAKEISAKEKIIQAECVRLNLPESHFNKTVGEAVQMGKEIATKCKEKGKIGFIESLTQWNVILTLIGVFGIGTIIFCMLALIRIGPGYGQNFLDSAAAAEKKLIELIGQGHELTGVYTAMKDQAAQYRRGRLGGIITPSYILFFLVIAFWIFVLYLVLFG